MPLGDDRYFCASDFPARPPLAHRMALFARAYGIHDLDIVRSALRFAKQRSVDDLSYFDARPAQAAAEHERVQRELRWLDSAVVDLVADLH